MNEDIIWAGNVESFQSCENVLKYSQSPELLEQMASEGTLKEYLTGSIYGYSDEDDRDERMDSRGEHLVSYDGSLAIINISGDLSNRYSPWNQFFGVVSYPEIRSALQMALLEPSATKIILNIDSNGGDAAGVDETSRMITQVDQAKPVVAHTSTKALSGGYWLGAAARKFYASKTAQVGSIGVLVIHGTQYRMLKEQGVDVTVFRAGTHKALGTPYEKLSSKASSDIQTRIDKLYGFFTEHVASGRGISLSNSASWANGKVFFADDARAQNLVDGIVYFDFIVEKLDNSSINALVSDISSGEKEIAAMSKNKEELSTAEVKAAQIESGVKADEVDTTVTATTDETKVVASENAPTEQITDPENTGAETVAVAKSSTDEPSVTDDAQQHNAMQDKLVELSGKLAVAENQLEAKTAECTALSTTVDSLKGIAVQATNKLQIALNQAPTALSDLPAETVVASYDTALESFKAVFGSGGAKARAVKTEQQEKTTSTSGKIYPVN